jgi:hypothetical protein
VEALYLTRFYLLASTRAYIAGVWWYGLRDQGVERANKEHNFGVLDAGMGPKPAAAALKDVASLLADVQRLRADSAGPNWHVSGKRANGATVAFDWQESATDNQLLVGVEALAPKPDTPAAPPASRP